MLAMPMSVSPEGNLFVFYADVMPNDVPMTRCVSFNFATRNRRREVWVAPSPIGGLPSSLRAWFVTFSMVKPNSLILPAISPPGKRCASWHCAHTG